MRKTLLLSIAFLYGLSPVFCQQQIENPGFEQWEDVGMGLTEPVDWSSIKTSDNNVTNPSAPLVWFQSTDAHSGSYSIRLLNESIFNVVATGTLTNGRVHADFNPDSGYVYTQHDSTKWNLAFTGRPDSLTGWFKYYPANNDFGGVRVILHVDDGVFPPHGTEPNWIAEANFILPDDTIDTWTRFSVPFNSYSESPGQYLLIVLKAGNGTDAMAGSSALFDDFRLIYNDPGAIGESAQEKSFIYYSDKKIVFSSMGEEIRKDALFRLLDISGNLVFEVRSPGPSIPWQQDLPNGIYVGMFIHHNHILSQKIYIDK
jgi:hypothetical protein